MGNKWDGRNGQVLAVFASYHSNTIHWVETSLLAFSLLKIPESHNADKHMSFHKFNLEVFGKHISNVVSFVGDNCDLNKSVAKKLLIYFVGFFSHICNLKSKDVLSDYSHLLGIAEKALKYQV